MTAGQIIRSAIHSTLATVDLLLGRKKPLITILCYHSIASDNWYFSNSFEQFSDHITALSKEYDFISLSEVEAYIKGRKIITRPSIVITFDDGYKNVLSVAPLLKKHGVKPTLFILANPEQANRLEMDNTLPLMSWSEIKKLQESGWEIGCHTVTHANLSILTTEKQTQEIKSAKKIIEKKLGYTCHSIAYPRGKYTTNTLDLVGEANYKVAVTMDEKIIDQSTNVHAIPRIGINASHSAQELITLNSPSAILFRHWVGKLLNNMS